MICANLPYQSASTHALKNDHYCQSNIPNRLQKAPTFREFSVCLGLAREPRMPALLFKRDASSGNDHDDSSSNFPQTTPQPLLSTTEKSLSEQKTLRNSFTRSAASVQTNIRIFYMMLLRVHLLRFSSQTRKSETADARQAINGIFTQAGRPVHPRKSIAS